jgi:hypothetical protein
MEFFFLALLAAAAALNESDEEPGPKLLPPPRYPDPDDDRHQYQKHAVQFWTFMNEPIVLWTERQDSAWLLGEFICPEGHREDVHIDMNAGYHSHLVLRGAPYPLTARKSDYVYLEKSAPDSSGGFHVWEAMPPTGYCHNAGHRGVRRFTIPHRVIEHIVEEPTRN